MKLVKMKKNYFIALMVMAVSASTVFAQEQKPQKIGTMNMDYILAAMPEIKSIQSTMSGLQTQLQKQGDAKQQEYQQKVVKYQSEGASMTIGDRQKLEREIAALEEELKSFTTSAQAKMETKQIELMGPINKRVGEALEAVVDEKGYTHIFNTAVPQLGLEILFYTDPTYDISNDVLKKLGIDPPTN